MSFGHCSIPAYFIHGILAGFIGTLLHICYNLILGKIKRLTLGHLFEAVVVGVIEGILVLLIICGVILN